MSSGAGLACLALPAALLLAVQATPSQAVTNPGAQTQAAEESVAERIASAPSVRLSNGQLTAVVLSPAGARRFYRGTRFDGAGMVASLTLRGHEFYGPWFAKVSTAVRDVSLDGPEVVVGANTAAIGPAEEFDPQGPLGFAEAKAGDAFVKIGVGELRRPDDAAYSSFRTYEVSNPGRWSAKRGRDRIAFTHSLDSAATGFGYRYRKTLRLLPGQPRLVIEHVLRNTGKRPIETMVFNHNFATFGGAPTDEAVSVRTPFPLHSSRAPAAEVATLEGDTFAFRKAVEGTARVFLPLEGFGPDPAQNGAVLRDSRLGLSIGFQGDQPLARMVLWSIRSVAAVEPFVRLSVAPGQEVRWSYAYTYEAP